MKRGRQGDAKDLAPQRSGEDDTQIGLPTVQCKVETRGQDLKGLASPSDSEQQRLEAHTPIVGVLAMQGAFVEHINVLRSLGVPAREVRKPEHLVDLKGLIIPGGESTAIILAAQRSGLLEPLKEWVKKNKPTWGTCAGLILLSDHIAEASQKKGGQELLGGLDVTCFRNFFGAQVHSCEKQLTVVPGIFPSSDAFSAVFIRAPAVIRIGPQVKSLATLQLEDGKEVWVAVQQGNLLATAFHPELTGDTRWHSYFLSIVNSGCSEPFDARC